MVHMANPDFPHIKLLSGARLPSHNIDEVLADDYTYGTEIWIYAQKEIKEDYTCTVDYYVEDKVRYLEKNLTIYSYSKWIIILDNVSLQEILVPAPPEILYTVEHTLKDVDDFAKPAKVGCTILTSPDTESRVTWSFNGKELSDETGKYVILKMVKDSDSDENAVVGYDLVVNNLEKGDVGPYTCQLHSDFHQEDHREVWIAYEEDKQC